MVDQPAPPIGHEPSLAAQCIRALLERHAIPKHKHSAVVTELLGLSYSAGKRRLTTNAPWSLEELRTLAEHFGESLSDLVTLGEDNAISATMIVDSQSFPCRIVKGRNLLPARPGQLVAVQVDSAWQVVVSTPDLSLPAFDVARLMYRSTKNAPRVAILDDHADTTATILDYLRSIGMDVEGFESLEGIAEAGEFDGYVLDWVIEKSNRRETVHELIRSIRARDPSCPIIVLTGQMRGGGADEQDIASALARYNLKFFEKPASMPIIAAALASAFRT
ncbi:helix-turn-helix domain-containing protein [Labrys sp. 22185]|uniref:helix-turn-helix domain-containing protein n=1 Tax=Labrys sp. 22185 TaxID=3453888 RepID=UPI003F87BD01